MKYEEIYEHIGHIGRYQWSIFAIVCVLAMYTVDSIHMVFIGGKMDHWCRIKELEGLPYDVQKNVAIPFGATGDNMSTVYSSCEMFALNYSIYKKTEFENWDRTEMVFNNVPVVSCEKWTYDQSKFESTIVKKFELVCGRDYLNELSSTLYMAGTFLGSLSSGFLSDKIGRKKTMLSFCIIKVCGNLMSIFGSNYTLFALGRVLIGFGQVGFYLPGFALVMELVGPGYRCALGSALHIAFTIGYMLQPAIAYYMRNEFTYQLAAVGPCVILPLVIFLFVPESTRWLLVHGKYDAATEQLHRICRINRMQLPPDFDIRHIDTLRYVCENMDNIAVTMYSQAVRTAESKNILHLLCSPTLRRQLFLIDISWFTCSLMYFALSLNSESLHGNVYVNTFMLGAVEVPANILAMFMMDITFFGRRGTSGIFFISAGLVSLMCIPLILLNFSFTVTVLSLMGKAFITVPFSVIYVYAAEIFPTEVRLIGMGTGTMFACVGSMAASFVGGPLADVWMPLPSLIYGSLSMVCGFSYIFLPETLGQPLPDTIAEVERVDRTLKGDYVALN